MTYERILRRTDQEGAYLTLVEVTSEVSIRWLIHYRSGATSGRWMFYEKDTAERFFDRYSLVPGSAA